MSTKCLEDITETGCENFYLQAQKRISSIFWRGSNWEYYIFPV